MLHQSFLSKCFKNVRYTYSRWACSAAAKNIINLYNVRDPDEPQWWVEQAYVVTAGICLILDLFHRADSDSEVPEYQACVRKAIQYLQQFYASSVAVHGVRILMSLLQEYAKLREGSKEAAPKTTAGPYPGISIDIANTPLPEAPRATCPLSAETEMSMSNEDFTQFDLDIDALGFEDLMDYFPVEGSLNNQVFFESIPQVYGQSNWNAGLGNSSMTMLE